MSTLRYGVEKSLHTTNQTMFAAPIILSLDNAYHTALCFTNDAVKAHMKAVRAFCEIKYIDIIAGKMAVIAKMNQNDDGERY